MASPSTPRASVIVRSLDKAATIERTLRSVREQTVPAQIVVVDSGSTDGTLQIAERYSDLLIRIAPADFSYGYALNLGGQAATGEIHFALSAHCVAPDERWIENSLRHYEDADVAATNGLAEMPDGSAPTGVYKPTAEEGLRHTIWGYSNHAASWRADAREKHPFDEDLEACEDKEWSWRIYREGWTVAFDPALTVPSVHRRHDGIVASWKRHRREATALARLGHPPFAHSRDALRAWWSDFPYPSSWPRPARRLSPHRAAEHLGAYMGSRHSPR